MAITKDIKTAKSTQEIQNLGLDTEFNAPFRESVTYNPVTEALERETAIQGNASLALTYTDGNLTTITKTISGTDYEKTLTYDVDGNLETVSVWSAA